MFILKHIATRIQARDKFEIFQIEDRLGTFSYCIGHF